ncbi:MAG: glycosyltransferase family 4 protein [Chloroflexi bacterium]|nr:glycosyltransferase family 4 protein [Chloroflexota bacterium]
MNKPRIAIVHYSAPPVIGGVESTIAAHARLLADAGYSVQVVAGAGEPCDARVPLVRIDLADSRHPRVTAINRALAAGTVGDEFRAVRSALRQSLRAALAGVDICIAHNIATLHKNLALTAALHECAQSSHMQLIQWAHDLAWCDPTYAPDLHDGRPWDLLRQAWPGARYVTVSTSRRAALAGLLGLPADAIAVVPPGIDAAEFLELGDPAIRWARQFDLPAANPLFLLPARITRRKNIELAIEIIAALRDSGLGPKLIIMGPLGPHNPTNRAYLDALQAQSVQQNVADRIIFLQQHGAVDNRTRRDLYALADALLFPSQSEGFGLPILEAGLARLPIFCADIAPFRETAGAWAHYFALDEPPATIAARIGDVLERDARYRLKRQIANTFTWDQIFRLHIEPLLAGGADA